MKSVREERLPGTFWWANFTQFSGAMNDNLFKLFMIYALIDWNSPDKRAEILALVGLAFAVPFLIFIPIAGSFADHYSKRSVIVVLKAVELAVMSFGIYALSEHSTGLLYVTIFLMSTQSAFFGPCKYGIIPEQVSTSRLSRANGVIQMFTYLAILAGTVLAPYLSERFGDYHARAASICILVAAVGLLCSTRIEPTPSHLRRRINFNGFINLVRSTRLIRRDGFLVLAVLAGSFFTLIGAFTQLNILDYGAQHLGLSEEQSTRLFLLTAIGIGLGSMAAGWISGRMIEFGIVPVGTALMLGSLVVIGTVPEGAVNAVRVAMFLIGIGAGFYVVPLEAFIQYRSPKDKVGSVKAANGFLSWIGVVLASGLLFLNSSVLKLSAQQGFLVASLLLLVLTVFSFVVLPDFFVKFVMMCLTRFFYKLRVFGIENLPSDRPALLVCNHVSLMDAVLVISSQQRRIRVLMSRRVYNQTIWIIRKIVDLAGVILVQDSDGPKKLLQSLKQARQALDEGFLVCIFAEGTLSLSGLMKPLKPGFERILKGSDHPVIPVYLGGVWGTYASWKHGRPVLNPVRDFRHEVSVHFGPELPSTATVREVQQAICEVSAKTFENMKRYRQSMARTFISSARRHYKKTAIIDDNGEYHTYRDLLEQAYLLALKLRHSGEEGDRKFGIHVRGGYANALLNLSLSLDRAVALPLDPDLEVAELSRRIQLTGLKWVISDQAGKLEETPAHVIALEDLVKMSKEKTPLLKSAWIRWTHPSFMCRRGRFDPDDLATIQFTRGRTGLSNPVSLSHHNILSNVEALNNVVQPTEADTMLGVVPCSNIYGYTITIWLPILSGIRVVYTPTPFDLESARDLSEKHAVSILPTTPGFIRDCIEKVSTDSFRNLRYVFTGGAPLDPKVAEAFLQKFGVPPLEGYGATELSPVCSLSLPDISIGRFSEVGTRSGRAGRLLEGIAVKIVNAESCLPVPTGETGIIMVKGPNVMLGYWQDEALTRKVLVDGWFYTGDTGAVDTEGFVSIVVDSI